MSTPKLFLIFFLTLLFISLYFVGFSYVIGSDYRQFTGRGDFINMLSFAFVSTALTATLVGMKKEGGRTLFLLGLGILSVIMLIVVSLNRYLAVYPTSGAESLFLYVAILDFLAAVCLTVGVGRATESIFKKQLTRIHD